jgi:PPIC-type PPIASE domain
MKMPLSPEDRAKIARPIPPKVLIVNLSLVFVAATALVAYAMWNHARAVTPAVSAAPQLNASSVVATVDGHSITELEISGIEAAGVDRANALDRTINKVLLEELSRKVYPQESQLALEGSAREVLAQLYVSKRTAELTQAISPADVQRFYDANVKAEDYGMYKVRFYVTQDPKEADQLNAAIQSGSFKDTGNIFKPVTNSADEFTTAQDLPHGLGQIVKGMKPGAYSGPLTLRSGITSLRLDDSRPGARPELTKVADRIKELVVAQRLSDELSRAHRQAHIELH